MPASSTAVSVATSAAAVASTARPSADSVRAAQALSPVGAKAAGITSGASIASGQRAGGLLEDGPGLVAEALLPLGVEAGLLQRLAEGRRVRRVEGHALLRQVVAQAGIQLGHVGALQQGGGVPVLRHALLRI